MDCFIACTPYHVLLAMNMVGSKADIFVVNQFRGSDEIVKRLKKEELFHDVVLLDEKSSLSFKYSRLRKNHFYIRINMLLRYLFSGYFLRAYDFKPEKYTRIFFTYSFLSRVMYMYSVKKNKEIKSYRYEDGIGDYLLNDGMEPTLRDYLAQKLIKKNHTSDYTLCLTNPELYRGASERNIFRIELKKDEQSKKNIERVFSCNCENWKYRFVFFDTVRNEISQEASDSCNEILAKFKRILGDNLIIKSHPRENERLEGFHYWSGNNSMCFESDCSLNDFSNSVFITISSTAVFNPKMIFGQQPTIVLLYKLFPSISVYNIDEFMDKFHQTNSKSGKVYIPESMEELMNIIKELSDG